MACRQARMGPCIQVFIHCGSEGDRERMLQAATWCRTNLQKKNVHSGEEWDSSSSLGVRKGGGGWMAC